MKNNFLYIIIAILTLVIFFSTCKKGCNTVIPIIKSDTVHVIDTTYLPGDTVKIPIYKPIPTFITKPVVNIIPLPSINIDSLKNQYLMLAEKHYNEVIYNDSVKLKDDKFKGKDLGTLYIKDVVSKNELKSRNISYTLTFPVINNTTTITNTVEAKKKIEVYAGIGLTGNKNQLVNGINGLLTIKSKKNVLYGLSAGYQESFNKVYPQFGASIQIKIGKRK